MISDSLKYKKVTLIKEPRQPGVVDISGMHLGQNPDKAESSNPDNSRFGILYDDEEQSFFEFTKGHFYVDENGLFFPITELVFGGVLGQRKAGDLLPADYRYEK